VTHEDDAGVDRAGEDLVAALLRWQDSGAVWQVVARRPDEVSVALLRCDGGEEVERLSSGAPAGLGFLEGRASSEE
jgi:hypothetical protein